MNELSISIKNVSKEYRLGIIGRSTLKADLQSFLAKLKKIDDPNKKIESQFYKKNERFWALDDITFDVKKGEALGIIGQNGAGKSTLLKLICRITTPSKGEIHFNGRITSMLEVGTGFHPELTGRENIYLNGAILGMKKYEIDKKFDDIVNFSEIEKFIDTPIKRYSSGMKVKLAFAVASHLESEIMIMDEVLAVGDVSFQNKCIERMKVVSTQEGRTVLFVSHNMNTIKSFCSRCIVLDHGHLIFSGDTENAIGVYLKKSGVDGQIVFDISNAWRRPKWNSMDHVLQKIELLKTDDNKFAYGSKIYFRMSWISKKNTGKLKVRAIISSVDTTPIGVMFADEINYNIGNNNVCLILNTSLLIIGKYSVDLILYDDDASGNIVFHDYCTAFSFSIIENSEIPKNLKKWYPNWGYSILPKLEIKNI